MARGDKLTLKQQLFVEAYIGVARGNGVEAARLAGYKGNDKTLEAVARQNLALPRIASRARARVEEVSLSADEILRQLSVVARIPLAEAMADPRLIGGKLRALEVLGRYHGLFNGAARNPLDAAREALVELRARYPDLSEEQARKIVSESFQIQESELVN